MVPARLHSPSNEGHETETKTFSDKTMIIKNPKHTHTHRKLKPHKGAMRFGNGDEKPRMGLGRALCARCAGKLARRRKKTHARARRHEAGKKEGKGRDSNDFPFAFGLIGVAKSAGERHSQ